MTSVTIIVAAAANDVIGDQGKLPWHIREDLKRFKQITLHNAVIMGRRTYDSIVTRIGGPLPYRTNIVLTHIPEKPFTPGVSWVHDVTSATSAVDRLGGFGFVIGGVEVYKSFLPVTSIVELTRIQVDVQGDASLPKNWLDNFKLEEVSSIRGTDTLPYRFERWKRCKDSTF